MYDRKETEKAGEVKIKIVFFSLFTGES